MRREFISLGLAALLFASLAIWANTRAGTGREFILVLDPGHTPRSQGAMSARGVPERIFNQRMAALVRERLVHEPALTVVTTNAMGDSVSNPARAELANRLPADLYLSIHHDSARPEAMQSWFYRGQPQLYCDLFKGYSILISEKPETLPGSSCFAGRLGQRLREQGFAPALHHAQGRTGENHKLLDPTFGIYSYGHLRVLKDTRMPAVILECGVIANREEEMDLDDPATQYRLVTAIVAAIRDYRQMCGAGP